MRAAALPARRTATPLPQSGAWRALALLLATVFLFGGGSRGDIASLMFLRPVAVLALGYAVLRIEPADLARHRTVLALALLPVALTGAHLVPLPPELWQALPGRAIIAAIDAGAGLGPVWRPLSIDPDATWNALFASLVPLAVVLLAIQLSPAERLRLLPLVLAIGGASALIGLLQTLGDREGWLYAYAVTNRGAPVGLFANRNHQAVLLATLLPILAVLALAGERGTRAALARQAACLLAGLCLLPLILVTGSRMGSLCAVIALLCVPLVLRGCGAAATPYAPPLARWGARIALPLAALALAALTVWLGRAVAWERFVAIDPQEDLRLQLLPVLRTMAGAWLPLGSGIGTFEAAWRLAEPDSLLAPFYVNHAHNDWLEALITGGIPAAVLALCAALAWAVRAVALFARCPAATGDVLAGRLGLAIVALFALGSWSDYPLRVPSLSCLFALAAVLASGGGARARPPEEA